MNIKELQKKVVELGSIPSLTLTAYISKVEEAMTSTGKPYLKVLIQDRTGEILLSKWDATDKDKEILLAGAVVEFGNIGANEFNGTVGLKTTKSSTFEEVLDNAEDYQLTIIPGLKELEARFKEHASTITNTELKTVLKEIVNPRFKDFINWPAAERMHHDVKHGLLFHTVGICDIVDAICSAPNYKNADVQLIKTAAMLHDIGKIMEYTVDDEFNGTLSKYALKGHMTVAVELIHDLYRDEKITEELELMLTHLILSHHGKLEYGSPVKPSCLEAYILHIADILDARTYTFLFEDLTMEEGEVAKKGNFALDGARLYKTSWKSV